MKNGFTKIIVILIALIIIGTKTFSQENSIKDLDFLIGTWKMREDNEEKTWWEKSTRIGRYTLDSTYIELKATAISSKGKERTYLWLIHYNSKAKRFEMVSMFSNWHNILFDLLHWDKERRTLTIQNNAEAEGEEYHERFGEIVFEEGFSQYTWTGENRYGDPDNPGIWRYEEKGMRIGH